MHYPNFVWFENFLKSCRLQNIDIGVESTAKVVHPFQVQTHIFPKHNFEWIYNFARVVFMELHRRAEQHWAVQDNLSLEIC